MAKPCILKAADLPAATVARLRAMFDVLDLPDDPADHAGFLAGHGGRVRGLALRKQRVDAAFLDALPALEVISSYSAGLDNLDLYHARARGVRVINTSAVLANDVADTAMALILALTRGIVRADGFIRAGEWGRGAEWPLAPSLAHMRAGIVGLGGIGQAIASRLSAFGVEVHYSGPNRKPVDLRWHPDLAGMAAMVDLLIVTCPLSAATRHLVNADVLARLGPRGFLVNIARGPIVDEAALIAALAANRIAGAGLDVFEHEPLVPPALIADPRVLLTPHIGSATVETRQAMADHVVTALAGHFGMQAPAE